VIEPGQARPWLLARWLYRRARALGSQAVDAALGVRTTIDPPRGPADDYDPRVSMPTGWLTLYRVFRRLDVGPDDVVVDIGSGTGRALLIASRFPFRRVIGVEREEAAYRQAEANLARCRLRPRAPVELVRSDVLDYRLPDDVTVVFLYNPFVGRPFHHVVEALLASVDRVPRRVRVAYVNPKEQAHLAATGRFRLAARLRGLRPGRDWARSLATHIYEVEPPSACADPEAAGTARDRRPASA